MQNYQSPPTFQDGKEYLYWPKGEIAPARVTFAAYDPCSAFIIIRNGEGKRFCCSRDDLFINSKGLELGLSK